jgi:Tn3 transposase DDE domain
LFSSFIACGVWEAVYILDGLLQNHAEIRPDTLHADTQGQSETVFGLAHLLAIQLMPRFRHKLPSPDVKTVMLRACPTLYGVSAQLPCRRSYLEFCTFSSHPPSQLIPWPPIPSIPMGASEWTPLPCLRTPFSPFGLLPLFLLWRFNLRVQV